MNAVPMTRGGSHREVIERLAELAVGREHAVAHVHQRVGPGSP